MSGEREPVWEKLEESYEIQIWEPDYGARGGIWRALSSPVPFQGLTFEKARGIINRFKRIAPNARTRIKRTTTEIYEEGPDGMEQPAS